MALVVDNFPDGWMHARETRLLINGTAGAIEVLVNGVQSPRAVALICHPHPLYGGSLDNKVVFTIARACHDSNILVVRFNFRGVGRSEGDHAEGIGEMEDACTVLARIRAVAPALPVIFAGFSFGASVVARLAQKELCAGLLLVAPPVSSYAMDTVSRLDIPVLLMQGDDDEVVDSTAVYRWFEQLYAPEKKLRHWPQAGHFFHGVLPDMKTAAEEFFSSLIV
jgi:alpha/beta superfamily hydrolase